MKKLSEFSVNYPITILMFVFAVLLLGYISFEKLGMDLFPDLNNPRIFVELKAGERPPEEMEKQFVQNIESVAIRQKKVTQVYSVSRVGTALITVEYSWDADMDEAFLDLQKSITSFGQNSDIEEITLSQHDPNSEPVMLIGINHPEIDDMDELRKIAENYLRNEIIRLEGIAAVEIIGGEEKEVVVNTNPYLLEAYGLSLSAIASKIRNSNLNASGGSIVEQGKKFIIKGQGEFQNIEDIGKVIVTQKAEAITNNFPAENEMVPVYLREVADIRFNNKDPENIVHIDDKRSIALAIYKETKYNTVKAVEELSENLISLKKAMPGNNFIILKNQAEFIGKAIDEVEETALIGIILAVIILYVFLRRIGVTGIISIAIPISVVATFNLMYFNGLTVNIMTLGGLALGAGMLVDNAIVVMENIFRNLEEGLSLRDAAIIGTSQVGGAITASTITTIVVFLPIVYLHGTAGELFKDQALTVAFSLLSSLVVAILVIPMLSHRFLKNSGQNISASAIHFPWYNNFLKNIIDNRGKVLIATVVLLALTFIILPLIGSEFVPKSDTGKIKINIKLDEGTALKQTDKTVSGIVNLIKPVIGNDLEHIYTRSGPASGLTSLNQPLDEDENTAVITIFLKPEYQQQIENLINNLDKAVAQITDADIQIEREESALQSTLGTDQTPVVVEIKGDDLDILQNLTEEAKLKLSSIHTLFNIQTNFEAGQPEINVTIDRILAGIKNIGVETISAQLQEQLQGKESGDWEFSGEMQDIMVKIPSAGISQIENLYVSNGQENIRLADLATIDYSSAPKEIYRNNQNRIGKISAQISGNSALDKIAKEITEKLESIHIPENYSFAITGEEQKRSEAFENLKFALLLSIILIYMVLASQFESLIHPFTIILTIPLAAVGAVLIFFIMGKPLNVMAYIGIILLVGIAVNDSIILVDAINQLKKKGLALKEAILEAGQRRIRPIMMTSITTILALLPLTIGFGESAALRAPMALAVIGGLVTSTLLTLVVIPCVYYVLDGFVKNKE